MPTGPGDDVLDAIEAGAADNEIMTKFKVDDKQLKAFKSLHYGLSNQEMAYEEIGSYYPELESYFKEPKPVAPMANAKFEQTGPVNVPLSGQDAFKLTKERSRLGKELAASQDITTNAKSYMGAGALSRDQDPATIAKRRSDLAAIDDQLKAAGYDPEETTKALSEFPNIPGIDASEVMQMKLDNPQQFDHYKAAVKSQYGLLHAVNNKEGAKAANEFINNYVQAQAPKDYASQRQATQDAVGAVYKYVDNADEQRKLLKDLVRDKSFGYGVGLPGQEDAVLNDPRSERMNPYQVTAMQFMEDVDPARAEAYNRLLAFSPEETEQLMKNSSFARGFEVKNRDLENMGMNLMRNSLEENLSTLVKKAKEGNMTDEERGNYEEYNKQIKDVDKEISKNQFSPEDKAEYEDLSKKINDLKDRSKVQKLANFEAVRYNRFADRLNEIVESYPLQELHSKKNELVNKLNVIVDKYKDKGLTDAEKEKYQNAYSKYIDLQKDFEGQGKRYPAVTAMDADHQMQDAMGSSTKGLVEQTVLGIGENVDDAINWVGDLIQEPFRTSKETALDDLQQLGDKRLAQLGQHETEGQELFGREFKTVFTGDLKMKIDDIKANGALSDDEQRDAIRAAVLKDNRESVSFVPNDQAGKANFTAKTVLNTVSNVASDLVPQIALAYLTGGGANATKLQELTSLFGTTWATAYSDIRNEAIEKDIPNPGQYALVHTTIEAGTELLFNDLDKVKKLFGGSKLAGKILENVTEADMKLLKTGRFAKLKEALRATGKAGASNAGQETFEEVAGQLAGNVADKKLFNQEVNATDDVLQTGVTTFIGMLPLAGLGLPFQYKKISQMQKYAVYEAAMNPDKYLARVDQDLQAGTITSTEAEARQATITKAAKLAKVMNAVRSDGSVMTDNEKTELLTNELVADSVKEQKKNAPEETKEQLEKVEETLNKEKEKLLKPPKNASKTKAKDKAKAETQTDGSGLAASSETTSPADEGAAEITTVGGVAAPAGEMRYTNPAGTEYVLRGDQLAYVNNKGQETIFSQKAMQTPETQALVETIKQSSRQQAPQVDIPIETEEDFEREVAKVMQNKGPKMDEMATPINNPASENSFDDYFNKAKAVINELLPGIQVRVHEKESDYLEKEQRPKGSLGVYDPQTNSVAFNLEAINRHGRQRNVFHEILHPIVNQVIGQNQEHLEDIYSNLEELGNMPGMAPVWEHMNLYFDRGGKIQKVEAVTQFLTLVADGKIDTSAMSEKTITKIIDVINKILEALGVETRISTASDIKRLSDSVVKAFQGQDVAPLKSTLGNRLSSDANTEALDALSGQDQEDAIRALIKKTPASVTDDKLKAILVKSAGITDAEAQDLIDSVRKPQVAPQWTTDIANLTPESKRASIAKIDKILEVTPTKQPSWWQRQWEGVKNASAWTDNPYRFITKITEDINKAYGLTSNEQIPLGRQFEKSASGRAILKVDALIDAVIRGNINGERLGRLKGERYVDFQRYLTSMRIIDRLNKQEEKQLAGEDVSRQTGNATRQDAQVRLEALREKYGNLDDFEARAKALQEHMDTMLKNLVASGILSQETYDAIKNDNDFYVPFSVVQSKLYAQQEKQPVGISGVVKRIKGIDYQLPKTQGDALTIINALGGALKEKIISPEEYFNVALQILKDAKDAGLITEVEYDTHIAALENPGFAINDILDAAANMIYKAEGMALRNRMLQRLYAYKASDPQGIFIQDVDGFDAKTLPDGSTRMVPKPLSQVKVEPGMAPIELRVGGKDVIVAVNKRAAEKLTVMSNAETADILRVADFFNKVFRATVITVSPGFQVVNFLIDFTRTSMLSRYGPLAGKGLVQPIVNAALYMPQYIEALLHSVAGNLGYKTDTYKQWMESDSFSKGMFDNLFDNEKRIKEVNAPLVKRALMNLLKLKFIEVPGSILEQTHKLATHQRGMSVEGFKPEMFTAMLGSIINRNIKPNMSQQELNDAMDRLNYEVQNFAGSPNFPQTHGWMKAVSMFLQFFSARVKGEMTDYRRVSNLFTGKSEGVKLSKQDVMQIGLQFAGSTFAIAMYAILNNLGDDDEKEFDGMPPYQRDNYLNIPLGYFDWEDENGESHHLRDYAKVPLRGLTATMNVAANSFVKYYKRHNPEEFKKAGLAFLGNASPINLHGRDERELGESLYSNLTPIFKYFIEYSFNRDTHNHKDVVPDFVTGKGMLSKYRNGDLKPWDVATKKTPQWAKDGSKWIYDNTGCSISAIELDHMENTMGNPTELYDNALKKRLFRSEAKYPLYVPKTINKHTSSATVTPVTE